jgi:Lar family restriction alleviation protein
MELKPCPFCGCKATLYTITKHGIPSADSGYESTIICETEGCSARVVFWALEKQWAIDSAIYAWNRRAEQ